LDEKRQSTSRLGQSVSVGHIALLRERDGVLIGGDLLGDQHAAALLRRLRRESGHGRSFGREINASVMQAFATVKLRRAKPGS